MAMLSTIKKIVIAFARAFDQYANESNLTPISIKLLDYSPINIADNEERKNFVTFELSTRNQRYDFRLIFAASALQPWHEHSLKDEKLVCFIKSYHFLTFKLSHVIYNCNHRALEISLDRTSLLNSLFTPTLIRRDIVFTIYQRTYKQHNSLTNDRIGLVWKILVRFLQNQDSSFQMIEGGLMSDAQQLSSLTDDGSCNYVELLRSHSQNLIAHPSNDKYLVCICHEQEYLKFNHAKNMLENESYPINFILIRVASIMLTDKTVFCEQISQAIKDCHVDADSQQFISDLSSMIRIMSMFTSKLSTPITPVPKHYVKRCVSLIYNVNRIRKILQTYKEHYSQLALSAEPIDYTLLSSNSDWFLVWHHIRLYDQTIGQLYESILDGNNSFEPNRMLDQTRKLMHEFSVYYRNVKVLLEPIEHVKPLIRARVQLFSHLLQRLTLFCSLANIHF